MSEASEKTGAVSAAGVAEPPRNGARRPDEFREERACPYCAEQILKEASVCNHCRHDVEPLGTGIAAQTPSDATPGITTEPPTVRAQASTAMSRVKRSIGVAVVSIAILGGVAIALYQPNSSEPPKLATQPQSPTSEGRQPPPPASPASAPEPAGQAPDASLARTDLEQIWLAEEAFSGRALMKAEGKTWGRSMVLDCDKVWRDYTGSLSELNSTVGNVPNSMGRIMSKPGFTAVSDGNGGFNFNFYSLGPIYYELPAVLLRQDLADEQKDDHTLFGMASHADGFRFEYHAFKLGVDSLGYTHRTAYSVMGYPINGLGPYLSMESSSSLDSPHIVESYPRKF